MIILAHIELTPDQTETKQVPVGSDFLGVNIEAGSIKVGVICDDAQQETRDIIFEQLEDGDDALNIYPEHYLGMVEHSGKYLHVFWRLG